MTEQPTNRPRIPLWKKLAALGLSLVLLFAYVFYQESQGRDTIVGNAIGHMLGGTKSRVVMTPEMLERYEQREAEWRRMEEEQKRLQAETANKASNDNSENTTETP